MSEPLAIGIDLGTTHSLVAVLEDGGPRVLLDESGESLIPSVVALDDKGVLLVGHAARERAARGCRDVASRFKSDLGTTKRYRLGDRDLDATALSALVLRELVQMAEASLGETVDRAVITVPAWFRETQRRATVEAAQLAGLQVTRLVNEPTAAALEHGLTADDEPVTVAVVDLGGGTFDVTILELFDGVADVRGSVGDLGLGGEDVTDLIVGWALAQSKVLGTPAHLARVRSEAERAKRMLSEGEEAVLRLGEELVLTRAVLDGLTAPFADRLAGCIQRVLMQVGLRADGIDTVLLVGGATRMPLVTEVVRRVLGQDPAPPREVDRAVALGAAVQAGLVLDHRAVREKLVVDVLTHSLGVSTMRQWEGVWLEDRFDPVLPRGTTLPASRTSRYHTMHHQQKKCSFTIYEGEHREASQNHRLGQLVVEGLPPLEHVDARQHVEVRFTHDASGLLEVEARAGEQVVRTVIQRAGVTVDPEEQARILQTLAGLKTHPRELLPNRWLLERGARVITWLAGGRRAHLDAMLDAFEAALEGSDPQRIEERRASLAATLDEIVRDIGVELDP